MERRPSLPSPGSAPLNKHPSDANAALHLQYRSPHHMYFDSKPLRSGGQSGESLWRYQSYFLETSCLPCVPASPYLLGVYLLYRSSLPHQTVLQRSGTVRRSHGLDFTPHERKHIRKRASKLHRHASTTCNNKAPAYELKKGVASLRLREQRSYATL